MIKYRTDKELADELDARERLEKRGWTRVTCEHCKGYGYLGALSDCPHCSGRGYHWQSPNENVSYCVGNHLVIMEDIAEAVGVEQFDLRTK